MNQSTPKEKTTNTQSIRLPIELYERIAELAINDGTTMNAMILRLINLGLGHQTNFEKAVRDFVFRYVTKEEMEKLQNGNS